jgi:hypothetical protein
MEPVAERVPELVEDVVVGEVVVVALGDLEGLCALDALCVLAELCAAPRDVVAVFAAPPLDPAEARLVDVEGAAAW